MNPQQLSGLDAAFISQDSSRTPMHICAALIYDVEADGAALSIHKIEQLVAQRLRGLPLFQRKLQQVPMGMDTPHWVKASFEPARHIVEHQLPRSAQWQQVHKLLDHIHSTRMDLALPLWEIHLLHGLDNLPGISQCCQALVLKTHHAAIDGVSLAAIISALHNEEGKYEATSNVTEEGLSGWELWKQVGVNSMGRQFKLAQTVKNLVPRLTDIAKQRVMGSDLPAVHRRRSQFNAMVSSGRHTGAVLLPLDEVREIKRSLRRVTLNDIALCCVGGALRKYLLHYQNLPEHSLVSGVPVSLRKTEDGDFSGNKLATMGVALATHVADPVERALLIHRTAVAAKKRLTKLGSGTIMDISDSLAPNIISEGIRTLAMASQLTDSLVPFHTMVSNVPGPVSPVFLNRARLLVPIGLGPIRDNMGLFHFVCNSDSTMSISFSACKRLLPDPLRYKQFLLETFEELKLQALNPRR